MKVRVSIPVVISMELDEVYGLQDAVDQVKSICRDDPSIITAAIDKTDSDISITFSTK